jgi:hypothetical protein
VASRLLTVARRPGSRDGDGVPREFRPDHDSTRDRTVLSSDCPRRAVVRSRHTEASRPSRDVATRERSPTNLRDRYATRPVGFGERATTEVTTDGRGPPFGRTTAGGGSAVVNRGCRRGSIASRAVDAARGVPSKKARLACGRQCRSERRTVRPARDVLRCRPASQRSTRNPRGVARHHGRGSGRRDGGDGSDVRSPHRRAVTESPRVSRTPQQRIPVSEGRRAVRAPETVPGRDGSRQHAGRFSATPAGGRCNGESDVRMRAESNRENREQKAATAATDGVRRGPGISPSRYRSRGFSSFSRGMTNRTIDRTKMAIRS